MIEFDDKNISWTKKHKIRIPYINEKGLNSYYVPDFLIIENIVETKGYIKENDLLKVSAGIEYLLAVLWRVRPLTPILRKCFDLSFIPKTFHIFT